MTVEIPMQEIVSIDLLKRDGKNPNRMTSTQLEALKKNLVRYGFIIPIITNDDYVIADGEHRLAAAQSLNMQSVPIIRLPIKEVDRKILRQVLNKLRGEHAWELDIEEYKAIFDDKNQELLRELLAMKDTEYQRITDTINSLQAGKTEDTDMAEAFAKIQEPITKVGDRIRLGNHVLVCGDSLMLETYERLMKEEKADMILTDPPYGLSFTGTVKGRFKAFENDQLQDHEFGKFIKDAISKAHNFCKQESSIYACIDFRNDHHVKAALKQHWDHKNTIVWSKDFGGLGYHYRFRHEFILYGVTPGATFNQPGIEEDVWELGEDQGEKGFTMGQQGFILKLKNGKYLKVQPISNLPKRCKIVEHKGEPVRFSMASDENTDVWKVSSLNSFSGRQDADFSGFEHPTIKPVPLMERALKNSSMGGGVVLDMFAGSGSTLIACERTGRRARCIELDPKYCDLIVMRWEKLTNKKAVRG